jgi:hypothetical protein
MTEKQKLRPEQRKVWRRVYLTAFEAGSTTRESERMADEAVEQWEARGAFDEMSVYNSTTWQILAERLLAEHPDVFQAVYDALTKEEARRRTLSVGPSTVVS